SMTSVVMDTGTPATPAVSNYVAASGTEASVQQQAAPHSSGDDGKSALRRLARQWFALRYRLSATVFAKPLPAPLKKTYGYIFTTVPIGVGFLVWSCINTAKKNVKGSGPPVEIMMLIVFVLGMRNNKLMHWLTGISFERALEHHRRFGTLAFVLTCLHGLAWLLRGTKSDRRILRSKPTNGTDEHEDHGMSQDLSGSILFYLVLALYLFSRGRIRHRFYQTFVRMHWILFILIAVFCVIHGAGLVLIGVVPWVLDVLFRTFYLVPKHAKGTFTHRGRGVAARTQVIAVKLPENVIRIEFPRVRTDTGESFAYEAGQYVFLCIPQIAWFEWHPFTISSAPHEAMVTIHIRVLGDWTKKLQSKLVGEPGTPIKSPFTVLIEGPYGSVSVDVFNPTVYSHVALISGGIGVTPMQSIANQLYHDVLFQGRQSLQTIMFVWSVRERGLVAAMLDKSTPDATTTYIPEGLQSQRGNSHRDVFKTEIYLTKTSQSEQSNALDQQLAGVLHFNKRPDVVKILTELAQQAQKVDKQRVAVLVCGPRAMTRDVVKASVQVSKMQGVAVDEVRVTSNGSPHGNSALSRLARRWFALRHRLSTSFFALPLPFFTAYLDLKVGDFVITIPIIIGSLVWSCLTVQQIDIRGSGIPAMWMMFITFLLAVRNNSVLLCLTGLSFERALFYHRTFGLVAFILVILHGLAWVLDGDWVVIYRDPLDETGVDLMSQDLSGTILFYLTLALFLFSLPPVRRRFFELFVRTHWILFILIAIFCAIHGADLVTVGLALFALDMLYRAFYVIPKNFKGLKGNERGVISRAQVSAIKLPGDVIRIQFPRVRADTGETFEYEAGQYVFLCIPRVAWLEWHPFTISSAPHEEMVTIHIRVLGDWTRKLQTTILGEVGSLITSPFVVLVDGPYGSVSIDVFNPSVYTHVALFAGGIGVTPMQSVANQLYHDLLFQGRHALKKIWFVWSIRERDMLRAMVEKTKPNATKTYLPEGLQQTRGNSHRDIFKTDIYLTKTPQADPSSPLDQQLAGVLKFNERPDIAATLVALGEEAKVSGAKRVAVLVCGPAAMIREVIIQSMVAAKKVGVAFDVHQETFDF
ncbi:TPA: hypothetical protein N0F65_009512, partial [Lagenidium giganteum]